MNELKEGKLKLDLRGPHINRRHPDPNIVDMVQSAVDRCCAELSKLNERWIKGNPDASQAYDTHDDETSFNISSAQKAAVYLAFRWDQNFNVTYVHDIWNTSRLYNENIIIEYHKEMLRLQVDEYERSKRP